MDIEESVPIYLLHNSGRKFWEVSLRDRYRNIRFGKVRNGLEMNIHTTSEEYPTRQDALDRIRQLLEVKQKKGYSKVETIVDEPPTQPILQVSQRASLSPYEQLDPKIRRNQIGAYVEIVYNGKSSFYSVAIYGNEISESTSARPTAITTVFSSSEEAQNAAKTRIRQRLCIGYVRNTSKFLYDAYRWNSKQIGPDLLVRENPDTEKRFKNIT